MLCGFGLNFLAPNKSARESLEIFDRGNLVSWLINGFDHSSSSSLVQHSVHRSRVMIGSRRQKLSLRVASLGKGTRRNENVLKSRSNQNYRKKAKSMLDKRRPAQIGALLKFQKSKFHKLVLLKCTVVQVLSTSHTGKDSKGCVNSETTFLTLQTTKTPFRNFFLRKKSQCAKVYFDI